MPYPRFLHLQISFLTIRWVGCALACWVLFNGLAFSAQAEESVRSYNIPEGNAVKTLRLAARQGDVDIMFAYKTAKGVRTRPVEGLFTVRDALARMLEGSPLSVVQDDVSGAYAVVRRANREETDDLASGTLLTPNAETRINTTMNGKKQKMGGLFKGLLTLAVASHSQLSAQDSDEIFELSPFEVSADAGDSLYSINNSSSGTRIAAATRDLPFSLDVLTTDFMDDFMIDDMSEALDVMSNVSDNNVQSGAGGGNATRGFSQWYALRDGFYRNGVVSKTMIDRVEVIKGPYAAIYGKGDPGGIQNFIPKQAIFGQNSGKIVAQYGENESYRGSVEQNISLGENTALLVAAGYVEDNYDQEYSYKRERDAGFMFRHRFSDRDEVTLEYEHLMRRNNRANGVPMVRASEDYGTISPLDGLPIEEGDYTGEIAWDFMNEYGYINTRGKYTWGERVVNSVTARWIHSFNDAVTLRTSFYDMSTRQPYMFSADDGNGSVRLDKNGEFVRWDSQAYPRYQDYENGGKGLTADLTARWNIGESSQTTLLTFDQTEVRKPRMRVDSREPGATNGDRGDIYRDYSGADYIKDPEPFNRWGGSNWLDEVEVDGLFLMHQAKLFDDKLLVMAGMRYDKSKSHRTNYTTHPRGELGEINKASVSDTTYNIGLNYDINARTLIYGSFATSFNPTGAFYSHDNTAMPNQSGEGKEIGIRTSGFDDKITFSLAAFEIERLNEKVDNPDWLPSSLNASTGYDNIPSEGDIHATNGSVLTLAEADALEDAYRASVAEETPSGVSRSTGWEFSANGKVTDKLSIRVAAGVVDATVVNAGDEGSRTGTVYAIEGLSFRRVPQWNYSVIGQYQWGNGWSLSGKYKGADGVRLDHSNDRRRFMFADDTKLLDLTLGYKWKTDGSDRSHAVRLMMRNVMDEVGITTFRYLGESRNLKASYTLEF